MKVNQLVKYTAASFYTNKFQSKKETSLQNKYTARKVDSEIIKPRTEQRTKKKSTSYTFLQKSTEILQTYNALFKKPLHHLGDADTYFKQSLRNYNDIDLLKNSKWNTNLVRPTKSLDSVKTFVSCHNLSSQ